MSRFNTADAEAEYAQFLACHSNWDAVLASAKNECVSHRFSNIDPDPISPAGAAADVDFELYMTDEFVRPAIRWAANQTSRCDCKIEFDNRDRPRLADGGSPLVWEYREADILEHNLSGDIEFGRLRKRNLLPEHPEQIHVSATAVKARYFDQESESLIRVVTEEWRLTDDGFTHDRSFEYVHELILDQNGCLLRIETAVFTDGKEAGRTPTYERPTKRTGILNRLFGRK